MAVPHHRGCRRRCGRLGAPIGRSPGDRGRAGRRDLSESWAREICGWSSRLPEAQQGDADQILADAARGGADLAGLAGLAREMYERSHRDSSGTAQMTASPTGPCGWAGRSAARAA